MAHKRLRFNTNARRSMERGVNKLADAVRVTLGPKDQYAVLQNPLVAPTVTNDGVTSAGEIYLEDILRTRPPNWSRRSPPRLTTSQATGRPRRSS